MNEALAHGSQFVLVIFKILFKMADDDSGLSNK